MSAEGGWSAPSRASNDMHRHFILTNGRSGSNYFVHLINQHDNLVNYGEVLGDWTLPGRCLRPLFGSETGAPDFLDWLYASEPAFWAAQAASYASRRMRGKRTHFRRRSATQSLGVKEFSVNLKRYRLENYLAERPDIRLIALVRANPVARLLSARLLKETGAVARTDDDSRREDRTIVLDPSTLAADLAVIEAENASVRAAADFHGGPVFRLSYEEYFAASSQRQAEIAAALQDFLGVSPASLQSEHRRLRRRPLEDVIANYAAVRERLSGGPFERWLEEAV